MAKQSCIKLNLQYFYLDFFVNEAFPNAHACGGL